MALGGVLFLVLLVRPLGVALDAAGTAIRARPRIAGWAALA